MAVADDGGIIGLATVPVKGFQRVERGRVQNVRPHTETEDLLNHLSDDHDIPQAAWMAGQKEWEQRGEAAWRAAGARYTAMHNQDHRLGTAGHDHSQPITTDQVADALAKKAGRGGVSARQSKMQGMLARDMEAAKGSMEHNPLLGGGESKAPGAAGHALTGMSEAARTHDKETIRQTALRGMAAAAVASRNYTEDEAHKVIQDIKSLAEQADQEVNDQSKASLVMTVVWAMAGLVLSAITSGMGVPLLLSLVIGLLPTAAGEIIDPMLVEGGHGRQAVLKAHAAVSSSASKAKTTASKARSTASKARTRKTALAAVTEAIVALAASGASNNSPEAMTREVLYRALLAKGAPEDVANALVDGAINESRRTMMAKRTNQRMSEQAMRRPAEPIRLPVDELVRRGHGRLHEEPKGPPSPDSAKSGGAS